MWEEYLHDATAKVRNKYRARRIQAQLRRQILTLRERNLALGMDGDEAMARALMAMGPAPSLADKLSREERQQHGWLWMVALSQVVIGIALVVVSSRAEYLAGISLGRVLTIWGMAVTGFQARHFHHGWLTAWRGRPTVKGRIVAAALALGGLSGTLGALLTAIPWELFNNNMFDPVATSEVIMLGLGVAIIWVPLAMTSRSSPIFRLSFQILSAAAAMAAYTGILMWYPGLVPPPFFNWLPPLLAISSFGFYFWMFRLFVFVKSLRSASDLWTDEDGIRAI